MRVEPASAFATNFAGGGPLRTGQHVAVVGNYPPTRCGIATFTADMVASLRAAEPDMKIDVYAMSDRRDDGEKHGVHLSITDDDRTAYAAAGRQIDASGAGLVWLQHEFGIFGGDAGEWIIDLLTPVAAPLVVTFHTVLPEPTVAQRLVVDWLVKRSVRLVVMSNQSAQLLCDVYGARPACVTVIHHGVPDRPFGRISMMKTKFGLSSNKVLLTFGLLSPNKGIETVIRALPAIIAAHPDSVYCIAGATHEKQREHSGEAYRDGLKAMAAVLGVDGHLRWIDRYLPSEELLDLIEAADVYITPYPNAEQATSGTLAYAVALGKAVVSTPYAHANELLAQGAGQLVPFGDANAIADQVARLLTDDAARTTMQRRAYDLGREMIWRRFGERSCAIIAEEYARPKTTSWRPLTSQAALLRLCDDTGMLQHGVLSVPDRNHGYCIDDNARALMLAATTGGPIADMAPLFAAFVQHGWNPAMRRFRNFMGYDRRWRENTGSQDSCGRTLWALGVVRTAGQDPRVREWAGALWDQSAAMAQDLDAPRSLAFAALGAYASLERDPDNAPARAICERTLMQLESHLDRNSSADWIWFESQLSYDNARLPEAMLKCALVCENDDAAARAMAALAWIIAHQTAPAGHFRAVGSNSFGRGQSLADPFDQQAVDAWATVDAAAFAYTHDGDERWAQAAEAAYAWFFGANDRGLAIADVADGSCFDGLTPSGVNRNQGAESVLSLHLAHHSIAGLRAFRSAETCPLAADSSVFA